jgi:hypothetical protein
VLIGVHRCGYGNAGVSGWSGRIIHWVEILNAVEEAEFETGIAD